MQISRRHAGVASALALWSSMTVACGGNPPPPAANTAPAPVNQNAATPTSAPGPPGPLEGVELARATALYESKCATCHLRTGTGDPHHRKDGIPDFTDAAWQAKTPDEELHAAIANGKGNVMPRFAGTLSDEQIAALVAYVRGFPTRPAPAIERKAPMTHGAKPAPAKN